MPLPEFHRYRTPVATMIGVFVCTTALSRLAVARPGETLDGICERNNERITIHAGRQTWARWMPTLRLTALWVPTTNRDDDHEGRGISAVPFASTLLDVHRNRIRARVAAVWDIAELFRPPDEERHEIRRVRCRYLRRRLRRRATVGPAAHSYPSDKSADHSDAEGSR